MTSRTPLDDTLSKAELLALAARMRAVSNRTYELFFRSGMGGDAHAFIEFCGVLSKYVDICERCAEQGIDFRFLNTHSGKPLPVAVHDMRYLGEKLDCILGPAIHANPAARDALRLALFGPRDIAAVADHETDCDWAKPTDQPATGPLRRKLGVARGLLMAVHDATTIGGPPPPTQEELRRAIDETADP